MVLRNRVWNWVIFADPEADDDSSNRGLNIQRGKDRVEVEGNSSYSLRSNFLPNFLYFFLPLFIRWRDLLVTLDGDESWLRNNRTYVAYVRIVARIFCYRFIGIVSPFIRIINARTYKGSVGELTSLFMRPHERALNTGKCSPGFASSPEYRQRGKRTIYTSYPIN